MDEVNLPDTLTQNTNKMPTSGVGLNECDVTDEAQHNLSTGKIKESAKLDNDVTEVVPAAENIRPSKSSPRQYHGLMNQGATCYLNSVLQVLFMTKEFREAVERYKCDTQDLDDLKKYTPHTFNITKQLEINRVYEQAHAAACLEQILTSLKNPEASQIFQGQITDKNIGSTCETETATDDRFWCLPLQLVESDKGYNVEDGINKYFEESRIHGENQMYYDGCETKSDADTNRVITEDTDVLMVQLMRFKSNNWTQRQAKVKCSVVFPYKLHILENQTYELYAFVEHFEHNSEYCTATIKSPDSEEWYKFNYDRVTMEASKLKHEEHNGTIRSEIVCLLFYKKVTIRPNESSPRQDHGLMNQGATCYRNSVLQVLFMTKQFREDVERYKCDTQDLDSHLQTLFDDLKKYTGYTYNITKQLGINRVYEQADAAACLEQILTSLKNPEASQIFQGQMTDKNICSTCETETATDDRFWCLPLQLVESDKGYNVEDGINKYFEESHITGENQMYCDRCDTKSNARTKRELKDHPVVLMLLLKRFTYRKKAYVKNHRAVHVPCTIKIPHDQTYELYAVVDHLGDLRSGHYTATIKSQDNERWYTFDDERVTRLGDKIEDSLNSTTAYLLFYRKQKTHSADTCTQDKRGDDLPATTDIEGIKIINKEEETTEAACVSTHCLCNQKAMNSLKIVLQVLLKTEVFRDAVERSTCGLMDQLKAVFELESKSNTSSISELMNKLDIHKGCEHDAAEYLVKILSLINASQCSKCSTEKTIENPFQHVPLEMKDSHNKVFSLVDGIKEYFRDPQHVLSNDQVCCDSCGHVFSVTKIKHPEVLVVDLRRFEFDNHYKRYVRNNRTVNVPRILQLPENQTYELYAFVDHVASLSDGHYAAAIKSQDEKWYNCDDSGSGGLLDYQRLQVDNAEDLENVYLLFYKKNETANIDQNMRDLSISKDSPPVNTDNNQTLTAEEIIKRQESEKEMPAVHNSEAKAGEDKSTSCKRKHGPNYDDNGDKNKKHQK